MIVPTFNRADLLIETLGSVHETDYRPIELIVVDDGSTDNTSTNVSLWAEYRTDPCRFNVLYVKKPNGGAPTARNHGLRLCSGQYIQFLDSDDQLDCAKIPKQVAYLEKHPEVDFAYGPVLEIGNPSRIVYAQSELTLKQAVLKQILVPTFTTLGPLCRRTMIECVGPWDEELSCLQDWEYFSRACVMGCRPGYVPTSKSYYRAVNAGLKRVRWSGERERLDDYVSAQFRRLESTFEHACPSIRNDVKFQDAIAWELSSATSKAVMLGWRGNAEIRYRQAAEIAASRFPRGVIWSVIAISHLFGWPLGARYFDEYRWSYFKAAAVSVRATKLLGKLGG